MSAASCSGTQAARDRRRRRSSSQLLDARAPSAGSSNSARIVPALRRMSSNVARVLGAGTRSRRGSRRRRTPRASCAPRGARRARAARLRRRSRPAAPAGPTPCRGSSCRRCPSPGRCRRTMSRTDRRAVADVGEDVAAPRRGSPRGWPPWSARACRPGGAGRVTRRPLAAAGAGACAAGPAGEAGRAARARRRAARSLSRSRGSRRSRPGSCGAWRPRSACASRPGRRRMSARSSAAGGSAYSPAQVVGDPLPLRLGQRHDRPERLQQPDEGQVGDGPGGRRGGTARCGCRAPTTKSSSKNGNVIL